jgi:hypothetical protein
VIRLWNRVGLFRALSVVLLISAVVVGAFVTADRPTQQHMTASQQSAPLDLDEQRQLNALAQDRRRAAADRAARNESRRKTGDAAVGAQAQPSPTPAGAAPAAVAGPPAPAKPSLPVPASCSQYSGNKAIGCAVLLQMGFSLSQMPCLDQLWVKESNWRANALNSSSGAYGIPQALPGSKMASAGADWKTNPATQIRWGLGYIKGRYSTPCGAWGFWQGHHWY